MKERERERENPKSYTFDAVPRPRDGEREREEREREGENERERNTQIPTHSTRRQAFFLDVGCRSTSAFVGDLVTSLPKSGRERDQIFP